MVTRQFRKHCKGHPNHLLQVISPVHSLEASLESRELESVCTVVENSIAFIHLYIHTYIAYLYIYICIHILHIYTFIYAYIYCIFIQHIYSLLGCRTSQLRRRGDGKRTGNRAESMTYALTWSFSHRTFVLGHAPSSLITPNVPIMGVLLTATEL